MTIYRWGYLWFFVAILLSLTNDVVAKFLSKNIYHGHIVFCRFFFGSIAISLYYVIFRNKIPINIDYLTIVRSVLMFLGLSLWVYGLSDFDFYLMSLLGYSIPIIILILSVLIIGERVNKYRLLFSVISLLVIYAHLVYNIGIKSASIIEISAICFALFEILNKIRVKKDTNLDVILNL